MVRKLNGAQHAAQNAECCAVHACMQIHDTYLNIRTTYELNFEETLYRSNMDGVLRLIR